MLRDFNSYNDLEYQDDALLQTVTLNEDYLGRVLQKKVT